MKFLRNQLAWLALSLLLGGVWWLMTRSQPSATATPDTPSLSAPITLTLSDGTQVHGQISGAAWACPNWQEQLQQGEALKIILPDGRQLTGAQVSRIDVPENQAMQAAQALAGSCPDVLRVEAVSAS